MLETTATIRIKLDIRSRFIGVQKVVGKHPTTFLNKYLLRGNWLLEEEWLRYILILREYPRDVN
jgi:hypothetical protein